MKRYGALLICLLLLCLTACGVKPQESPLLTTLITSESVTTTSALIQEDSHVTVTTSAEVSTTATTTSQHSNTTTDTTTNANTTITTVTTTDITKDPLAAQSREMRATWVSYIELDALFRSCETPKQAKRAIDGILDTVEELKLNTLYFHVRANSNAYYQSSYFKPAASVSKLISLGFDPLSYAVDAAHQRGIALHAWVNPYRVGKDKTYLVNGIPTFSDSSNRYYYVPSSVAAQQLILDGVRELVNNYAIDGIQYDDYFYPSDVLEETTVYSYESADYELYQANGGSLSIADWRRAAVDTLIAGTHTITKAKNCIFGVSPAADAQKTYNKLYANPQKWMYESGYIDYICPQIYTGFENSTSPFDKKIDEWLSYPRHSSVKLYVGIATYKAGLSNDQWAGDGKTEWATNSDILKRSVMYLRSKKISGLAFYSYSYLRPDKVVGLSSTNNVTLACKEIDNLRTIL